ncbi:MAG TPA: HAMP domain-containing sensor histidine kinase [Allosphingosinicella sp.]|nr:HAMP domain-containing sensor histidine kinase [Allosphingosinicella sp.]
MSAGQAVRGRVDAEGRLVEADPRLMALHRSAGGEEGGPLAVPQIAALARLARRLGIVISRGAVAAEGEADLELWVRAEPRENSVELAVTGWMARPARAPAPASDAERQADFLRAGADWMWETDASLRLTTVSAAAAAAAGKAPGQLVGRQLTRLFRLEEGEEGELPLLTALAEQCRFDGQLAELRGGRGGRYRLAGIPLIDGAGRFAGFRGSAAALPAGVAAVPAATDALPEPGAFGERLDKALRAPLARIIASAETIGAQGEGPIRTDYAGYAGDIATAGRHLLALVDDLVDLQAIERPDFRPEGEEIDLADVARRAAGLLAVRAGERQVRIDAPAAGESLPAAGDFRRALQIVVNLLTNAIRYSPEGGQVWIRADREGDLAALIIADQGKGISAEDQARIFEKFERVDPTEAGGTGLGLYIARRLARAMGGDVAVDSAPGQGARFTFTLPLRRE